MIVAVVAAVTAPVAVTAAAGWQKQLVAFEALVDVESVAEVQVSEPAAFVAADGTAGDASAGTEFVVLLAVPVTAAVELRVVVFVPEGL